MRKALFYVTAHGFGHAVRACQVMEALARGEGFEVVVRTAAPAWIFSRAGAVTVDPVDVDAGPAQKDCLTTDIEGTLTRFSEMMESMEGAVARELDVMEKLKPSVIVCDIAPLGVEAAARAGIPCVVVANFLWDWILEGYIGQEPAYGPISRELTAIYRKSGKILTPPLSGGLERYQNVVPVPLIARRSAMTKQEARASLGLPRDRPLALVSLGGIGSGRFFDNIERRVTKFDILVLGAERGRSGNIHCFRRDEANHEDLVAASDVVIGKMGYGLCSELIANPRPFLYAPRADFVEYNILSGETRRYVAVEEASREDFFDAGLDGRLLNLLDAKHPAITARIDGAVAAARLIAGVALGVP